MADKLIARLISKVKKHPLSVATVFLCAVLAGTATMLTSVETIWKAMSSLFNNPGPPRLAALQTPLSYKEQKEWGLSIQYGSSDDHEFALLLLVTARFSDDSFNAPPYLRSIEDLSIKSFDGSPLNSKIEPIMSEDMKPGGDLKWWVLVTFETKPLPSQQLTVSLGPISWSVPIGTHVWQQRHYEQGATGNIWESAQAQLELKVNNPNWALVRSARLLRAPQGGKSLLEVVVENFSERSIPLNTLAIAASSPGESHISCNNSDTQQMLTLNWDVIASKSKENEQSAWTTVNEVPVIVPVKFNGQGICSNLSFYAVVPVSSTIPPKELRRVQIAINELPPTRKADNEPQFLGLYRVSKSARGDSVLEWASLNIGLNPNEESPIFPHKLRVSRLEVK